MKNTGPRKATTFRPTADDRAAIALLRRELGEKVTQDALIGMGLRELLRKHNLSLPKKSKS